MYTYYKVYIPTIIYIISHFMHAPNIMFYRYKYSKAQVVGYMFNFQKYWFNLVASLINRDGYNRISSPK